MRYQIKYSFSDKLKRARKAANLTQKELAEKTGVSQNSINSYELGRRMPSNENLSKLSAFFETDEKLFLSDEYIYPTPEEMIVYNNNVFEKIQSELNRIIKSNNRMKQHTFDYGSEETENYILDGFTNKNYLIKILLSFYNNYNHLHKIETMEMNHIANLLHLIVEMSDEDVKQMIDFGINLKNKKRFIESDD